MVKTYKEVRACRMCKERFVLEKDIWRKNNWSTSYCPVCCKKYFNKGKSKD
ncbi:MAG: hypothetical protein KKC75_05900 [Nanoarchaeota archaeon]|nr:hypothetical protein [Nanoarchaeota archaeon]MBU1004600.1 hypothetical protein [Nanoarchaeota archaeon]MBU1946492.1 hypothetical protein [Nanoarchaeota archaeon]